MNNSLEQFIETLELPFEGETQGDKYVVEVDTSNDFSALFNQIDLNKDLHLTGESKATDSESTFRFTDGYWEVLLQADYDKDKYSLTVEEK